jgi:hypothetical protein
MCNSSNHRPLPEMLWYSPSSPFASTSPYKKIFESEQKLHSLFSNLSGQEISEMLFDCGYEQVSKIYLDFDSYYTNQCLA